MTQKISCKKCMKDLHDECIDPNTCLCSENNHGKSKISELEQQANKALGEISVDVLKESSKKGSKYFQVNKKGKQFQLEILDREIIELRPITLLDDNSRFILVYLPTKTLEIFDNEKKQADAEYDNKAFFVICNKDKKKILPIDDSRFKKNCKIKIQDKGFSLRWNLDDLNIWLRDKEKTEPAKLYKLHRETTEDYLDFENQNDYDYFTIWNIATYTYELFDAFPYNDYTGTKRAGKTKALIFQELVCYNAILTADITGASTFRVIEGTGATLLLDESESFKNLKNEQAQHVRTLLLEGFLKNKYALRTEKTESGFTPTNFNLYAPKSLGHIKALDGVLEERCIGQLMRRTKDAKIRDSWPTRIDPRFQHIRNLCYRLFLDYGDEIKDSEQEARGLLSLSGRELQLWTPIITLALFFENHGVSGLIDKMREKSKSSSHDRQIRDEEESQDLKILQYCENVGIELGEREEKLKGNPLHWIPTLTFYNHLVAEDVAPKYGIKPEYFTRPRFTEILRRLGFKSDKKVGGVSWYITRAEIDDVKERMGVTEPKQMTLDSSSASSFSSASSVSRLNSRNKTELNEVNEVNEPKVTPLTKTNKTEVNEVNEVDNNNTSSASSVSSAKHKDG